MPLLKLTRGVLGIEGAAMVCETFFVIAGMPLGVWVNEKSAKPVEGFALSLGYVRLVTDDVAGIAVWVDHTKILKYTACHFWS